MKIKNKVGILVAIMLLSMSTQSMVATATDNNENEDTINYSAGNSENEPVNNNSMGSVKVDEVPTFNTNDWDYDILDGKIVLTKYLGSSSDVIIPSQVKYTDGNIYNITLQGSSGISTFFLNSVISTITFKSVNNTKVVFPEDSSFLFNGCVNLTTLNFNDSIDTSSVTNMSNMFSNCVSLTKIDLRSFETSNVVDMYKMFSSCSSLVEILFTDANNLSFDTSSVINMGEMFSLCSSLEQVDLSGFKTQNVTNMSKMFQNCKSITMLSLKNFNTSNVTDMSYMFSGCSSLVSIDVSQFNTSSVKNMTYMFSECSILTTIDLSSFTTNNVTNMTRMFYECPLLKIYDLSKFDLTNVSNKSRIFFTKDETELLIIATDPTLINYGYTEDNRIPFKIPFNANGGSFSINGAQNTENKIPMSNIVEDTRSSALTTLSNTIKNAQKPDYADKIFKYWYVDGFINTPRVDTSISTRINITDEITLENLVNEITTINYARWNTAPTIAADDITINKGDDTFTLTDGRLNISINDVEDGKILPTDDSKVTITGTVDINTPGKYPITYEVVDSLGDRATTTITVTVNDPPVITAQGTIINKGQTINLEDLITKATDLEDGDYPKDRVQITGTVDTNTPGDYEITYTVTDSNGVTATTTITVTVNDLPVITAQDTIINKGETINLEDLITKATDLEDGDYPKDRVQITGTVDTNTPGDYEITYTVTDNNGATTTTTITVTVNDLPVITAQDTIINKGETINLEDLITKATDLEDGDYPKDRVQITGTVDTNTPGDYEITYTVTDNNGATTTITITVTVNDPPVITAQGTIINKGETINLEDLIISATDLEDGDYPKDRVQITGDVDTNTPGDYEITYTVTDSNGATATTTITVTVNDLPVITAQGTTINKGETINLEDLIISASDLEDGDYPKDRVQITGTVDTNTPGDYEITYTVTDSNGATTTTTITVTVNDPPVITAQDTIINKGETINLEDLITKATDLEDGDYPKDRVQITGDVDTNTPGDYEITYTVTDSNGATATTTITVTVNDLPVITAQDTIINKGETINLEDLITKATDLEDGDYPKDRVQITGTVDTNTPGDYEITYTVTDSNGATATTTITVTVNDLPVITAQDTIINKGETINLEDLITKATDLEDGDYPKDRVQITGTVDTNTPGDYEITYTVTDNNGATTTTTITVTVNDPPAITAPDKIEITTGDDFIITDHVTADDKEDGTLTDKITIVDNGGLDTNKPGDYTIVIEVEDSNGAKDTQTVVVTVKPKPPTISADDVTINVGDKYDPSDNVIITDGNGNVIVVTPDNIKENNVNPNVPGKYEVTYTVTENGITVDKTVTVTVLDKEKKPPIIDGNDVVINVGDFYDPLGNVVATDANGNKIILSKDNIIYNDVNVNVPGVYTVKYLVTDENGLTAEKTLKVTVKDKQVIAQTSDTLNLGLIGLILALSGSIATVLINKKRKKQ